jgi:hypothetical protein
MIGFLFSYISPSLYFIFLIFPADFSLAQAGSGGPDMGSGIVRLGGVAISCIAILWVMLARIGLRGVLDSRKLWRLVLVMLLSATTLFGGARSKFIEVALMFAVLFYLEGLVRSRVLPMVILIGALVCAVAFPFTDKMPLSVQRSLAVLPLVKIDAEAERNARDSSEWRLKMWETVIPTIPQYLILGKGLSLDAHDLELWREGLNAGSSSSDGAAMAGDYHNGPLSLIVQFGIPGVVGFVWFLVAGFRVLQRNYHYGDPSLQQVNRVLFGYFIVKIILFFLMFGSFYSDLVFFVGPVGLSIAINGGVCRRMVEQVSAMPVVNRLKLVNATR